MLLRIKIKNFLSFNDEVSFDMFPNPKRESFQHHIYTDGEVPLLKQAAIYGANGSGKSNFIKGVQLIKQITTQADALTKFSINLNKFRLSGESNHDPVYCSIEYFYESSYFIYCIEFDADKICKEELFLSGLGQKDDELLFRREGSRLVSEYANQNEDVKEAASRYLEENKLVSLLVLMKKFPFFKDNKYLKIAGKWFVEQLEVLSLRRPVPYLISLLSERNELLSYTNKIFRDIGIGIKSIGVEEKKLNEILSEESEKTKEFRESVINRLEKTGNFAQIENDNKVLMSFEKNKQGEQIVKQLLFRHIGINGFEADLGMGCQSEGTARILNLIPAFFSLEKVPAVFFIDEIENSIHPLLMVKLIKRFSDAKTKGQLIYTTHETHLLDQQEILRPDEVWLTEKHQGATQMYSLNEFKIHHTINIQNGYLAGRYGGIPFLGNPELLNDEQPK